MKKIYIGISILLGMLLLICLPNSVWAEDKKVEKIVVTIPEPVIDKQICMDASQITLKVNDEEKINIEKIEWEKKTYEGEYEAIKNTNELAEISHFYKAKVTFKLPENYTKDNDIKVIINDESSENNTIEELEWNNVAQDGFIYVTITKEFGRAKAQKEISKIEATGSELIVGEKLIYDVSKYNVTLDGNEKASVTEIVWEYADGSKCTENTIVEAGKKYRLTLYFEMPVKYEANDDTYVTYNGEEIINENGEEFTMGEVYADRKVTELSISKFLEAKNVENKEDDKKDEETKENNENKAQEEQENKDENKQEEKANDEKKIKNPKTGDNIVKSMAILVISVVGLALTIKSVQKQNK